MKIVDCFVFYNELQLLEYRLSILYDVVDYFIIVESRQTFVGKSKELLYEKNKNRFSKFKDKIIHVVVDLPYKYPNIDYKNKKPFQFKNYNENGQQWINEAFQRESITNGFEKISWNDEDYIIVSDVDEIPDPNTLREIKNGKINTFEIYKLKQDYYKYNLNVKIGAIWIHAYIMSYGFFNRYKNINISDDKYIFFEDGYKFIINNNRRMFLTELRFTFDYDGISILDNGGWHLSFFGDQKFINIKYDSFSHLEYEREYNENNQQTTSIKDNKYLPYRFEKYLPNFIMKW